LYIVEELIDPREVEEGLVDCLLIALASVSVEAICEHTTNIRPRSLTSVYFSVYLSYLYVGLLEAFTAGRTFSSIKTSLMRLLTAAAPMDEELRDQSTTPEVVNISKASSILESWRVVVV
jgi:hypothetical protein